MKNLLKFYAIVLLVLSVILIATPASAALPTTRFEQNIAPFQNGIYNLGTTLLRWGSAFFNAITVTGTTTLNGVTYTWPGADGSLNQRLTTDGGGGLSWATVTGSGGSGGSNWSTSTLLIAPTDTTLSIGFGSTASTSQTLIRPDGTIILNQTGTQSIFKPSGRLGIGTANPSSSLHVVGSVGVYFNTSSTIDTLYVNGSSTLKGLSSGFVKSSAAGLLTASPFASLTADVSGILPVANGGTGSSTTPTANKFLVGNGTRFEFNGLSNGTNITVAKLDTNYQISLSGVVALANGGTATSSIASDDGLFISDGTNWANAILPSCDNHAYLYYASSTRTFSCVSDLNSGSGGGVADGNDPFKWIAASTDLFASSTYTQVGIGNLSPSSTLHVTGDLYVTTSSTLSGAVKLLSTLQVAASSTFDAYSGLLVGNGTSVASALQSSVVGQILRVTGSNTFAFGALDLANSSAVTGVLPIANGGTATSTIASANGLFISTGTVWANSILPSCDNHAYLYYASSTRSFSCVADLNSGGSGTPGGSNTQVQFNDASTFGGNAGLTFTSSTVALKIGTGSAADSTILFDDTGTSKYAMGLDISDFGKWKLSASSTLGTNDILTASSTYLTVGTSTIPNANTVFLVDGQQTFSGAPAAVSACGTSPTMIGNDAVGKVTVGTGGIATSCTVTFAATWTNAPTCVGNNETTTLFAKYTTTATTLTIVSATPFAASDVLSYACFGYKQ